MDIPTAIRNLQALKANLPKIAANEMLNFALDNIKAQQDINGAPLKPRKPGSTRNTGRAILVDTGDGRRSLRGVPDATGAHVEGVNYMIFNNEGAQGSATARSKKGKSYTRAVNLPQRKFIGAAPALTVRIENVIAQSIVKALT